MTLSLLFLVALVGALSGLLGGYGGRAFRDRLRWSEAWDAMDGLEKRLSKREGQAGRARRDELAQDGPKGSPDELKAFIGKLLPGGREPAPGNLDPTEMERRRAVHFRKKDGTE